MVTLYNNVEISLNTSCVPATMGNCSCYLVCRVTYIHIVSPSELNELVLKIQSFAWKGTNYSTPNCVTTGTLAGQGITLFVKRTQVEMLFCIPEDPLVQCSVRRPAILNYVPRNLLQCLHINTGTSKIQYGAKVCDAWSSRGCRQMAGKLRERWSSKHRH
jgi:hypothetical protein